MANRADLRSALRLRLEDTSPTPLWTNTDFDQAIAGALTAYGARVSAERTLTLTLAEGDQSATLPVVLTDRDLLRLFDPNGEQVARWPGHEPWQATPFVEQSWRLFAGDLQFIRPAAGGDWLLEYRANRSIPGNDSDPLDIEAGDEEFLIGFAMAILLERRAVEDVKRGLHRDSAAALEIASSFRHEAEEGIRTRHRQVRSF